MMQHDVIVRYDDPPVTEVVIAVAFQPLGGLTVAHMGQFWGEVLAEYFPHVEERPPYEPPVESFDGPTPAQLSLTLSRGMPTPRLWFKSSNDQELLQLQRNWFACNWRKSGAASKYTHWPSRREAFAKWLTKLVDYLSANNLGLLQATQCEVTYINHIAPNEAWKDHGEAQAIFRHITDVESFLPEPEEFSFQSAYAIRRDGEAIGRLHVSSQPVVNVKDGGHAIRLDLTARGAPLGDGLDGMLRILDIGREWIVSGFDAMTSDAMHRVWGKQS